MADEIEQYLNSLDRSSRYRVINTLKASPHETTELVDLTEDGKVWGPFIRKRISRDQGIGKTYERIYDEQRRGTPLASIPEIYECYETEDSQFVVMEYIRGETLADAIFENDPSPNLAMNLFPQICDAASELHERFDPPIIHRDLKPSNIMISDHGVKIIDFGIARTFHDGAEKDTKHFGTPSYAPPEQFGFGQTDERSDVYALGMLLYYCLTERTPTPALLEDGFDDPAIPVGVQPVIEKATSFDPANRYESASKLKEAFLGACGIPGDMSHNMPPYDSSSVTPRANRRGFRIPEPIGWVWNILVAMTLILCVAGCVAAVLEPTEENLTKSTAVLVLTYPVLIGASFCFLAYLLMDKRLLREKIPALARVRRGREILFCLLGIVVCWVLAVAVYMI